MVLAGIKSKNINNSKYEDNIFPKDVFQDEDRFAPRYDPDKKYNPDFSKLKSHKPMAVPFEWQSSYINQFS